MKKADNFDASKWLVENKITTQSRLNENEAKNQYVYADKDGDYFVDPKKAFEYLKQLNTKVFKIVEL